MNIVFGRASRTHHRPSRAQNLRQHNINFYRFIFRNYYYDRSSARARAHTHHREKAFQKIFIQ